MLFHTFTSTMRRLSPLSTTKLAALGVALETLGSNGDVVRDAVYLVEEAVSM